MAGGSTARPGRDYHRPPCPPVPPTRAGGPSASSTPGVGGLTVLHELLVALPHEDFVYLGDTARFPYGERPAAELEALRAGDRRGAARARREAPRRRLQLRHGRGAAGAAAAHAARRRWASTCSASCGPRRSRPSRRRATAGSGCWPRRPPSPAAPTPGGRRGRPARRPRRGPVPRPRADHPGRVPVRRATSWRPSARYVAPLREADVDTVDPRLHALPAHPPDAPADARARRRDRHLRRRPRAAGRARAQLARRSGRPAGDGEGDYRFLCTGDTEAFRALGTRFLQLPLGPVEHVDLRAEVPA